MLTTEQILTAMFTPVSMGAYSAEEVDAFLKKVAESYETALQNNKELIKKISILADKIESYRNDEEAIKLALLDARRLAESINKEANDKAAAVVKGAEMKAESVVADANAQAQATIDEAREKAKEIVDGARVAVASLTDRAQRETEQAITAAQQKATEITLKAEAQGREIIGSSKADYEYYTCELERLKKETAEFKATIEKLCAGQMELISSVRVSDFAVAETVAPVEEETVAAEEEPVTETEPEIEVPAQEPVEEVAKEETEAAEEPVEEAAPEIEEAPVAAAEPEAAEEIEEMILEIPEYTDEADDIDDLFSSIEDVSFDDIVAPEEIPATLDDVVAEASADFDDDDDDDVFDGFKIDLDGLTSDSDDDGEEDITSLFDSFFDD